MRKQAEQRRPYCLNGPNCYYLQKRKCFFYHPPHHYERLEQSSIKKQDTLYEILQQEQKEQEQKQEQKNNSFLPPLIINGVEIPVITVQNSLSAPKNWFYSKLWHFEFPAYSLRIDDCAICLENYNQFEIVTKLYCNHIYHHKCLQMWLASNSNCPLCKQNFTQHDQFKGIQGYQQIYNVEANSVSISWMDDIDALEEADYYFDELALNIEESDDFNDHDEPMHWGNYELAHDHGYEHEDDSLGYPSHEDDYSLGHDEQYNFSSEHDQMANHDQQDDYEQQDNYLMEHNQDESEEMGHNFDEYDDQTGLDSQEQFWEHDYEEEHPQFQHNYQQDELFHENYEQEDNQGYDNQYYYSDGEW